MSSRSTRADASSTPSRALDSGASGGAGGLPAPSVPGPGPPQRAAPGLRFCGSRCHVPPPSPRARIFRLPSEANGRNRAPQGPAPWPHPSGHLRLRLRSGLCTLCAVRALTPAAWGEALLRSQREDVRWVFLHVREWQAQAGAGLGPAWLCCAPRCGKESEGTDVAASQRMRDSTR